MPAEWLKRGVWFALCALSACLPGTPAPDRIALLAPFEGRYRDIGYEAYYAAQLALYEVGPVIFALYAIDDGGSVESAVQRAAAIQEDAAIRAVLVIGPYASSATVQQALNDMPVLLLGYWGAEPSTSSAQMLAPADIAERVYPEVARNLSAALDFPAPFAGSEMLALKQFAALRGDLSGIELYSSATLPTPEFQERYAALSPFAPEPGLIASLTYQGTRIVAQALRTGDTISLSDEAKATWRYRLDPRGILTPYPTP